MVDLRPEDEGRVKHVWIAQRLAEIEEERRAEAASEQLRIERQQRDAASRAKLSKPSRIFGQVLTIAIPLLITFIFVELMLTTFRFYGRSMEDATRTGVAHVLSCEQQGPIGEGLGYWDKCTAMVVWDDGGQGRRVINEPGFFTSEEIGTAVSIGQIPSNTRSSGGYAREGLPPNGWLTFLAFLFGSVAAVPGFFLILLAWSVVREGFVRLTGGRRANV